MRHHGLSVLIVPAIRREESLPQSVFVGSRGGLLITTEYQSHWSLHANNCPVTFECSIETESVLLFF